ncbi:ATP-binding protein [Leptospira yasudae]|uniref:ATP-binding protein n=1 Tax=Leptospira yasudae TaxID=2202201 RepID=UPI001083FB64|nr:ATP-binding protein [Leptospira yasudae]TGK30757.1 ATP-binding protein [Leptospira yasudae]TGM07817.1 ATP-binding protein [Leptospira yasudae]
MNPNPEIFICSVFLFLSSILFWLASTTIVNLERRDRSATFTIVILLSVSALFGFFSWIGESGLIRVSNYSAVYFFPGIFGLILIPFGWFFIVVWFLGFLREKRIYRIFFWLLLSAQAFAVVFFYSWSRKFSANVSLFHFWNVVPFAFRLSYLVYILFCIVIPIFALFSFRISKRILPEVARNKAVPYLKAVSLLLFGVLVLVFFLFLGGGIGIIRDPVSRSDNDPRSFYGFLIGIQLLVTIAILILGQALISYEIFTGRILPKISLRQEWRNANFGFFALALFYLITALFGVSKIELFLTASSVYCISRTFLLKKSKDLRLEKNAALGSILSAEEYSDTTESKGKNLEEKFRKSFEILCSDILETSSALFVNESRIPFIADMILAYPDRTKVKDAIIFKNLHLDFGKENIAYLEDENRFDYALCLKVESDHSGDGLLFLGQKINGGLYAEEEIETAKAAVTWILSSLFTESNSLVLSSLQRKHMEEQRISDYKTRQILHDEILPEIHSSILILSQMKNESEVSEQIRLLTDLHKRVSSFLRELPDTSLEIERLGLIEALMRRIGSEFEAVWFDWKYAPELKDRFPISKPEALEILFYACRESIRNAVKYSGESANKKISVAFLKNAEGKNGILIRIKNKIDTNGTQVLESAGQGLRIHSALLKIFGGYLTLEFLNLNEAFVEIFLPGEN